MEFTDKAKVTSLKCIWKNVLDKLTELEYTETLDNPFVFIGHNQCMDRELIHFIIGAVWSML